MFKRKAKTKAKPYVVEPFDDGGEIQVVPIDTVIDDGGYDLEEDNGASKKQSQGARESTSMYNKQRWREPDIVA